MKSTKLRSWTESLLGLKPLPAPPHVFALGLDELVYARFDGGDRGRPQLLERISLALPEGVFEAASLGPRLLDPQGLGRVLEELLSRLSMPVEKASLVLPDSWLRLIFLDTEELPVAEAARLDVLRWKMNRLLPFRIEDLRIDAQEVTLLPGQTEPVRNAIGFGREELLDGIERAFSDRGIELGTITNQSSGLLLALSGEIAETNLAAIAVVEATHYTLLATRGGEPILFRVKSLDNTVSESVQGQGILRDLRLTLGFLQERTSGTELDAVELVTLPSNRARWQELLLAGLGRDVRFHEFDLTAREDGMSVLTGAMAGAVMQEIS